MKVEELLTEIKKRNVKKVMIQLPEGLKTKAAEISAALVEHGIDCLISADPCYGACDLADEDAHERGCDLLVHVGHSKFYRDFATKVPVLYFPWTIDVNLEGVDFSVIKEQRIGLLTTIQHLWALSEIKVALEKQGKEVVIGGQVLGCWFENADKLDTDAFLYIGSGRFHPLGYRDKKIYALDVEKKTIDEVDTNLLEKRRYANIHNAKDARTFAILVTTKKGQNQLQGEVDSIKKKLREHGRNYCVISLNEINDTNLLGIRADAFINTACPRIIEDSFSKPIVNAQDLEELFSQM